MATNVRLKVRWERTVYKSIKHTDKWQEIDEVTHGEERQLITLIILTSLYNFMLYSTGFKYCKEPLDIIFRRI